MISRGGFAWGGTLAETPEEQKNPWLLLRRPPVENDASIPVVLDANTATYSLHVGLGDTIEVDDGRGGRIECRVVGLLKNSIFQGDLLMAESQFVAGFPNQSGYRLFLVDVPPDEADPDAVAASLEDALGDYGFDAIETTDRLEGFLAVQNTYLSTFSSLGAMGLLLGTFGLATVQTRNVLERRSELALMRATGFRRSTLATMVLMENITLLAGGMAIGVLAALAATLPHLLAGGASIPWTTLSVLLAIVLATGLITGLAAVRATLRAPLLAALREE